MITLVPRGSIIWEIYKLIKHLINILIRSQGLATLKMSLTVLLCSKHTTDNEIPTNFLSRGVHKNMIIYSKWELLSSQLF